MPVVPRLTNTQVRTAPLPGVAVQPETFAPLAGAVGEVAQGLGQLAQIQQRERARVDEVRVNESEVALRKAETDLLYNPKKGALFQTGTNAQTQPDRVSQDFRRAASEIEAGLATDEQKIAFRAVAARREAEIVGQVTRHAGQEFKKVDAQTFDALTTAEMNAVADLARAPENDIAIRAAVDRQMDRVSLYGDRNGWSPEAIAQARLEAASSLRAAQVATILDSTRPDRVKEAKLVMTEWSDQFTPAARAKIEDVMKVADRTQQAQTWADRLFKENIENPDDAFSAARESLSDRPELRDEVERRLTSDFARKDALEARAEKQTLDRAAELLTQAGGRMSAIPATMMAEIEGIRGGVLALRTMSRQLAEGIEPTQNWSKWSEFTEMSPADIAKLNPMRDLRPYMDDTHYERALGVVRGVQQNGAKDIDYSSTLDFDQRVRASARLAGIIPEGGTAATWNATQQGNYDRAARMAEQAVLLLEQQAGGRDKVNPLERQAAIDSAMARTVLVDKGTEGSKAKPRLAVSLRRDDTGRARVPKAEVEDYVLEAIYADFSAMRQNAAPGESYTITNDKVERIAALRFTMPNATAQELWEATAAIARDRRGAVPYAQRTDTLPGRSDR